MNSQQIDNALCRVVHRALVGLVSADQKAASLAETVYRAAAGDNPQKAYSQFVKGLAFANEDLPEGDDLPIIEVLSAELLAQPHSFFQDGAYRTIAEVVRRTFDGFGGERLTMPLVKQLFMRAFRVVAVLHTGRTTTEDRTKFFQELVDLKFDHQNALKLRRLILREILESGIWKDTSLIDKAVQAVNAAELDASRKGSVTHVSRNLFVDLEAFVMPFVLSRDGASVEIGRGPGPESVELVTGTGAVCICGESDSGKTTLLQVLKCNLAEQAAAAKTLCLSVGKGDVASLTSHLKLMSFIGGKIRDHLEGERNTVEAYRRAMPAVGGYALVMYRVVLFCDDLSLDCADAVAYLEKISKDVGICLVATMTATKVEALSLSGTFPTVYSLGDTKLNDADLLGFVEKYYAITSEGRSVDASGLAREFLGRSSYIKSFIDSPFFLSLAASIFQIERRMPETRNQIMVYCLDNLADDVTSDPEFGLKHRFEVRRALAYLGNHARIIGNSFFLVRDVPDHDAKPYVALGVRIGERRSWLVDKVLYKGNIHQYRVRNKTITRFLSSIHIVNQYQSHADRARQAADLMYNNRERDWLNYVYLSITVGAQMDPTMYIEAVVKEIFSQARFKSKAVDSNLLSPDALDGMVELALSSPFPNHVFATIVQQSLANLFDCAGRRTAMAARIINREPGRPLDDDRRLGAAWRIVVNLLLAVQPDKKRMIEDALVDIAIKAANDRFILCMEFVIFFRHILDSVHLKPFTKGEAESITKKVIRAEGVSDGVKRSAYLNRCMNIYVGKATPSADLHLGVFPYCPLRTLVSTAYFPDE